MKPRIVKRPRNTSRPYAVRYADDARQKSFATEAEAGQFIARLTLGLVDESGAVVPESFRTCAERFVASRAAPRTRESYASILSKHLGDFADRPVADVADDPQAVRDAIRNHPRGKHLLVVIRGACDLAVEDGVIAGHRLARIHPARSEDTEQADFIPATRAQLLAMYESLGPDGLTVLVMAGTGVRVNECLAVRGADFRDGWLTVRRQLDRAGRDVPMKHRQGGASRKTPVPGWLEPYLANAPDGRLFDVTYPAYAKRFQLAAARAQLPPGYCAKQLRHLFASMMLNNPRVPVSDVARWLGHRDSKTTYGVYGHLMPGSRDRGREASDAAWEAM